MEKLFVSYELAVKLKKKGFDEYFKLGMITSLYNKEGNLTYYANYGFMYSGLSEGYISAPLYQQVIDWLREKNKIHVYSTFDADFGYYRFFVYDEGLEKIDTSNRSLNQAIEEALKLII